MTQLSHPDFCYLPAVLLDIHTGSYNTKISVGLSVNMRTMQRTRKELDEAHSDYEDTAA